MGFIFEVIKMFKTDVMMVVNGLKIIELYTLNIGMVWCMNYISLKKKVRKPLLIILSLIDSLLAMTSTGGQCFVF